ncbi:multiple epidermal growth factor-like domains protein 10 [Scaptodrosophila lebanonensis]|uniref:Multiple epidermal growth factor-like domains protein 10 n=1 Tax=Drosophila lebanonensis TaxID=7225 RepID=A0A6J2TKH1_DROLE|nr:multiple epidermal growth factor-like domains protein 10 [Scaptodrosophila lebanonensis]
MKQLVGSTCLWLCLITAAVANKEHFCERNVTVRSLRPVTKQRTIVRQPSKLKFWKKAETLTEVYNTQEEQLTYKLVSECCAGYSQTDAGLCEPICERGCPAHASCVAPQRCQCTNGYVSAQSHRDGSHYCEPVCERACGHNAFCVAPNTCACREGFQALAPADDGVSGPCVPTCVSGQFWNGEKLRCMDPREQELHEELQDFSDVTELLDFLGDTTPQQVTPPSECEEGFVLYAGECRPQLFESNESKPKKVASTQPQDCRQPNVVCGEHQACNELGTCVCSSGYTAILNDENVGSTAATLADDAGQGTLTCRRSLLQQLLSIDQAADDEDELNPLTIPIIGLASGSLFALLLIGLAANWRKRRQQAEQEAGQPKPSLQCEFTQKSYDVDEWVP